jgi:cell division protein FtsI (penicillin-binding protein 3)
MKGVQFHASPVLAIKLPAWRSRFVVFLIFAGFAALIARALYLQFMTTDFLQTQGAKRYARTLDLPATRGKITDRNGIVLASSLPAFAIWAIPEDIDAPAEKLSELARLLKLPEAELKKKIANEDRKFVYLKRQVVPELADRIAELNLSGIHRRKEYLRHYPEGEAMAHVIGFTNVEDAGQEGMELAWQKDLAGKPGSRRVIKDRLGRVIEDVGNVRTPLDGRDLTLSIDGKVQYLAFSQLKEAVEKHKAKAGAIVVLDVQTGEVLALANLPSYDPNQRGEKAGEQLRNRVLTDTYEPGSTLKPFTISLAIENGRLKPDTIIQTAPGRLTIGSATISDSHAHGALTVEQVIQKSSNIGTAKIALGLPAEDMWNMFTAIGLGQAPRLGFPGAVAGRVRPFKNWRPIEQATMSYGYGLSVSLIQIARAYTIFARDGELIPLSFFKVADNVESMPGTRVISVETARAMRKMLEMATGPEGTAPKAQVIGYRVAGKTGTAHKVSGRGYAGNKYIGSFVGFAPASNPRIIVAVMIDEPSGSYFGGDVAAPVFSAVVGGALRSLGVKPDSPFKSLIIPAEPLQESI